MDTLDPKTIQYYEINAVDLFPKYQSDADINAKHFAFAFPQHHVESAKYKVLDIGCGTGRDLLRLLDLGYDAYGIDASSSMLEVANSQSKHLAGRTFQFSLFDDGSSRKSGVAGHLPEKFDGLLCSAVLHHIPRARLVSVVLRMASLLHTGGRLFLTLPALEADSTLKGTVIDDSSDSRAPDGRIYNFLPKEWILLLFERVGFRLIDTWSSADVLGRKQRWQKFLFSLDRSGTPSGLEALDKIIQNDKKTSTYKLALLRSLCELALSSERSVYAAKEGVHVPLRLVAAKFISYYWTLIADDSLPQITNRSSAFEGEMNSLRSALGMTARVPLFSTSGQPEIDRLVATLLKKVGVTIIKNPVYYAGGPQATQRPFMSGKMPSDLKTPSIIVRHEIWREMCFFGRWINDSLLMQWAQWTGDIASKKNPACDPLQVRNRAIQILTAMDFEARDTSTARGIFDKLRQRNELICTWTYDRQVLRSYDVDHILPFSHFRNNDIWNLVPASPSVNRSKSDKIPDLNLLERSQDKLIDVWKFQCNLLGERFSEESKRFTGLTSPKLSDLFDCLHETVATHEGRIEIWQGSSAR